MSFVVLQEANIAKPCGECINYTKCGDREWRSCYSREKEYWNQNIFVNDLEGFLTRGDNE